jgi:hypothetical protein
MKNNTKAIRNISDTISRIEVHLMALNWITSTDSEEYYSQVGGEDIAHNMKSLFSELRTIRSLIREDNDELRELKREMEGKKKNIKIN